MDISTTTTSEASHDNVAIQLSVVYLVNPSDQKNAAIIKTKYHTIMQH